MPTAQEVANWMLAEIEHRGRISQKTMVRDIRTTFGEEFTYINHNGNYAIDKLVLREFGKLKEGRAKWENRHRWWFRLPIQ